MRKRAGVDFLIYNPAYLLEAAERELNIVVAQSSVDDAAETAATLHAEARQWVARARSYQNKLAYTGPEMAGGSHQTAVDFGRRAEAAVGRWLVLSHPNAEITHQDRGPFDYFVSTPGHRLAVEVKAFRQPNAMSARMRIRETSYRAYFELSHGAADAYRLVLVAPDEDGAWLLADLTRAAVRAEPRYPITIGVLDEDGEFRELMPELLGGFGPRDV